MKKAWLLLCLTFLAGYSAAALAQNNDDAEHFEQLRKELKQKYASPDTVRPDYTQVRLESHPCENKDVMGGMWKMIYSLEKPPSNHDRINRLMKHQYLSLQQDGYYTRIRSARSIDDQNKIKGFAKPDKREGFEQKFLLNSKAEESELVLLQGKTALYRYSCSIVIKPASVYKPGDMVLTGYTLGGETLLFELYRRWF